MKEMWEDLGSRAKYCSSCFISVDKVLFNESPWDAFKWELEKQESEKRTRQDQKENEGRVRDTLVKEPSSILYVTQRQEMNSKGEEFDQR
jgi:hypothetical protein